jgi:hypothetical protein
MTYFNLELSTLRAGEFLGSEPVARATWLCVVGYCIDQENDGRIKNCRDWKDRQWQQTCGVTLEEVQKAAPLLIWEETDLVVWRYPLAHQTKWQKNRVAGRNGGRSRSEAKIQAARLNGAKHNPSTTEAQPKHQPNIKEDKVKEDKVKESILAPAEAVAQARTPDLIFEALCAATGIDAASLTKSGRGALNAALRDIRVASPEVTPEEIKRRAGRYVRKFSGAALTAPALAKHWAACAAPPADDWTRQQLKNAATATPVDFAQAILGDLPEVRAKFDIK